MQLICNRLGTKSVGSTRFYNWSSSMFHNNNEYAVKARVNLWPVQPMALDTIKADV